MEVCVPERVDLSTIRYSVWDKVYNTAVGLQGIKVETSEDPNSSGRRPVADQHQVQKTRSSDKGTWSLSLNSSGESSEYQSIVRYKSLMMGRAACNW